MSVFGFMLGCMVHSSDEAVPECGRVITIVRAIHPQGNSSSNLITFQTHWGGEWSGQTVSCRRPSRFCLIIYGSSTIS